MGSPNSAMETLASQICTQITTVFTSAAAAEPGGPSLLDLVVDEIAAVAGRKGRIFVYGVGREGLMLRALCMRLAHLGLPAHCLLHVTTPPIAAVDLLLASAGPGGFSTVDALCAAARSHGARVLLLTACPDTGSCVRHATALGYLPARTMADDGGGAPSLLPMGSLYEAAMFVLFEMVVFRLGDLLGETPEAVRSRHTNLE